MSESINKELYAAEIAKEIAVAIIDKHGLPITSKGPVNHVQDALTMFETIYQGVLKSISKET